MAMSMRVQIPACHPVLAFGQTERFPIVDMLYRRPANPLPRLWR